MKRYIIFGAGNLGSVLAKELSRENEVIGFLDNNKSKWGNKLDGYPILGNGSVLSDIDYDEIVIASTMRYDDIKKSLMEYDIPEEKFNSSIQARLMTETHARVNFLRDFAKLHRCLGRNNVAVAEGGVFHGMFAEEINRYFPEYTLYLFDTFEGFDERDVAVEREANYSDVKVNYYNETTEEIVLNRLPHREKAVIRKGFFPETTEGLPEEKYIFVNLDFDLYSPILAGLRYFFPRMEKDGVMLVHDYFTEFYHGVGKAVEDYEKELGYSLRKFPIGDGISIAIFKERE